MGRQSKRLKKIGKKSRKMKRQVGGQVATAVTVGTFAVGLTSPSGGAIHPNGNMYVANTGNHTIQEITPTGVVSLYAGKPGTVGIVNGAKLNEATFRSPTDIAIDGSGNMYIADSGNHVIRKIDSSGAVNTFAGTGVAAHTDSTGNGGTARFNNPNGICIDFAKQNLYVADTGNNRIRKIVIPPSGNVSGAVTTVAGSGTAGSANGSGTNASFSGPKGITITSSGTLYVADTANDIIREITPGGIVATLAGKANTPPYYTQIADGIGDAARFNNPIGICIDSNEILYIGDSANNRIRKITPDGSVSTFSGNGTTTAPGIDTSSGTPTFNAPKKLILDSNRNIFVFDGGNNKIRKITGGDIGGPSTASTNTPTFTGRVDTFAGNATFNKPSGGVFDFTGIMYVADTSNHVIRRITPAGVVTTIAGTGAATVIPVTAVASTLGDGLGTAATFNMPTDIVFNSERTILYVTDSGNHKIRKITIGGTSDSPTYSVSTVAGGARTSYYTTIFGASNGTDGATAKFNNPNGLVVDSAGNLYVADTDNHLIRKITFSGTAVSVSVVAGTGAATAIPTTTGTVPYTLGDNTTGTAATFNMPTDIIFDSTGTILYVADSGNDKIRRIVIGGTPAQPTFAVSTIAGGRSASSGATDGIGAMAKFDNPTGIIMDSDKNLYVADSNNHKIRKIVIGGTPAQPTYTVSTMVGSGSATAADSTGDGNGATATFNKPKRLLVDYNGATLYVFDTNNNKIRKITGGNLPQPVSILTPPTAISGAIPDYPLTSASSRIDAITFQKVRQTNAWDSPLYSEQNISGGNSCYIAFKPGQVTKQFIIGFNDNISTTNPTDITHSTGIDRGFYMDNDATFYITELGAKINDTDGTYVAGDVFNIIYDTINFIYIKNGTTIRSIPIGTTRPNVLYLDGSMYDYGTLIQNVYFGTLDNCPIPATS
jgi:sugar lactone lactonase YvrE